VNDYALGWWVTDQKWKPDTFSGYNYDGTNYREDNFFLINYPNDTYKIFAFCVQSPCYALGATPNVGGFNNANLSGIWGGDSADPFGNHFGDHCWHSGEFYFSTVEQWGWWEALLDYKGFNLK
jgi:hypothetical protein